MCKQDAGKLYCPTDEQCVIDCGGCTGLPSPERVLEEVCTVSEATATSRVVAILALGLLDRVLNTNSPATRLAHDNWSLVWLFCIHFAAKIHYDVCAAIK